jgi:hypothetical protein
MATRAGTPSRVRRFPTRRNNKKSPAFFAGLFFRTRAEAEFVTYPGKRHGFDFSDTDPMAAGAVGRVVRFFETPLGVT